MPPPLTEARLAGRDLLLVFATTVWIDRVRKRRGPAILLPSLRERGRRSPVRTDAERARLRRFISFADRLFPDRGNCYRRVLVEITLDPMSADEQVHFGLKANGGHGSGHAWLSDRRGTTDPYDAELAL